MSISKLDWVGHAKRSAVIAGIQFERRLGDLDYNVSKAAELVSDAAKQGARIIALPELFSTGYFPLGPSVSNEYFDWAETADGSAVSAMRTVAKDTGATIIVPIFEFSPMLRMYYNTAFIVGPSGILGTYRKRHLPSTPLAMEAYYFSVGNLPYGVFEVDGTMVGVSICYDRHFPEVYRHLALKGAEVVFSVNNTFSTHNTETWEFEMRASASSNGIYIVQNNAVGEFPDIPDKSFFGRTSIVDPYGTVLKRMGAEEGFVMDTVDLGRIDESRRRYGPIRDARYEDLGLSWPAATHGLLRD